MNSKTGNSDRNGDAQFQIFHIIPFGLAAAWINVAFWSKLIQAKSLRRIGFKNNK